jgi:hypothetical protein
MKTNGLLLGLFFLLAGCAVGPPPVSGPVMIPGRIYCLKDGTEFQFAIERSSGQGMMTALNTVTGERFTGTYSAMVTEGGGVEQSTIANNWGTTTGTVSKTTLATKAIGRGVLRGDKGTVISFAVDIKPSYHPAINPSGFGEGTDNNGLKYQIQFG